MENQEEIKGFNDGYKLARFMPQLAEKLEGSLSSEHGYEAGVIAGINRFRQEKEQQRSDDFDLIRKGKNKGKEQDRGR